MVARPRLCPRADKVGDGARLYSMPTSSGTGLLLQPVVTLPILEKSHFLLAVLRWRSALNLRTVGASAASRSYGEMPC